MMSAVWPFDPSELVNKEVEVDGMQFRVLGVERNAMSWRPGSERPVGLLLRPLEETPKQTMANVKYLELMKRHES